jgi:hypothetical protein
MAIRKILAATSVGIGGYLIYAGLTGARIPFEKPTIEEGIRLDRVPLHFDGRINEFTVKEKNGREVIVPRDKNNLLKMTINSPVNLEEKWPQAEIRMTLTNLSREYSKPLFASVMLFYFDEKDDYKKMIWVYEKPLQLLPNPIKPGATVPEVLTSPQFKEAGKETKPDKMLLSIGWKDDGRMDRENVGLAVTLYSDVKGSAICAWKTMLLNPSREVTETARTSLSYLPIPLRVFYAANTDRPK